MKRLSRSALTDGLSIISKFPATRVSSHAAQPRIDSAFPHRISNLGQRYLHTSPKIEADVHPITASGPPPSAPVPSAEHVDARVARRRKQAELLKRGQDLRAVAGGSGGGTAKTKRFWKDVHVKQADVKWLIFIS